MFEKFFTKYARAVSDDIERARLYKLYCAKTIARISFFILCIAIIAESLMFSDWMAEGTNDVPFIVFGFTLLFWFAAAIASLALWIRFRSTYRKILSREPSETDMPEVVSYRQKIREEKKSNKKAMLFSIVLLIASIVFMIVAVGVDVVQNPDSDDLGIWSNVGIGVFAVCLFVFFMSLFFLQYKKAAEGNTVEMQTAEEAKAIDAAQGREHKYSLQEDKNAQTYRYLFPNEELCRQAESARKKMTKATRISVVASCVIGITVNLIFFSSYVFDWQLQGYAYPVFMTILFAGVLVGTLPYKRQINALEKRQKLELETCPEFEKNLAIYRKYEAFSKVKGKVLDIFYLSALILSYVLAAIFPNKLWSVLPVAILLLIGLALNFKFVTDLRKEVRCIEEEIDREREKELPLE